MQKKVEEFNKKLRGDQKDMPVYARLLDTQSEMGELAKEYLKATDYGTKDFAITEDFEMEFGDVLYCLLSLAGEVGVDANDCLDKVIDKYQKRLEKKKDMGSGR